VPVSADTGIVADWPGPSSSAEQTVGFSCLRPCRALRCRAELEVDVLAPHAMHDDGEFARDGHAGLLAAHPLGELHAPGPQRRSLSGDAQMGIGRLVEAMPQEAVAALADVARSVHLTGLIDARRQAEMRRHGPRRSEPRRIVDGRLVGQADDRADAWNGMRRWQTVSWRARFSSSRSISFFFLRIISRASSSGAIAAASSGVSATSVFTLAEKL